MSNYKLVFLAKANIDVAKAYKYYGEIGENLINKFDADLEKTIERIKNNPKHFRKVKRENRQLRVFHTSRNPKYKYLQNK